MTIRGRIALVSAAAVAIAVIVIALGTFAGVNRQVLGQVDDSLITRAELVSEVRPGVLLTLLGLERADSPRNRIAPPRPDDFDSSYYQLIFGDGRAVNIGDDDLVLPPPPETDSYASEPSLRSEWVDGVHFRIATITSTQGGVTVQIARPLSEVDDLLRRLAALLLIGGVVGVALAAGLGLVIAKQAVEPIDALKARVGEIAESRSFSERVEVVGTDEVAELAGEFNLLLDELQSSREQQVRLVRDAGHELRTPLTALRTNIEVLQRHEVEPAERAAMLSAAQAEVEELGALVAEVVDLAADRYEEEPVGPIALSDVAASVAERFSDRLTDRTGREITVTADASVVMGKSLALARALSNIVGNADKFAPSDAPIAIDVAEGVVTVTDGGPGFEQGDLPHVFERFFRSDSARSEPGSGLGLSIVKQIIDDHDGEVFARNGTSGGAEVGFKLPGGFSADS
jgi:two-component system sensor histidine kinase MprB